MKVLVTPRSFAKNDVRPWEMLQEAGLEVFRSPLERPLNEEELIQLLEGVDGVIVGLDQMTAKVICSARSLKAISKYGVGWDNIDIAAATARGIPVTITPGANATAVAELTLGLMLAVARRIPEADRLVRSGVWRRTTGRELGGKTLGLVGLGTIGRLVAKMARGLDMKVLAFDQHQDASFAAQYSIEYTDLFTLLSRSDFVSIHLPLNETTRNMIGERELRMMRPDAYLINTARGGIVDERALIKALKEGVIAGAALDVFVTEPPAIEELKSLDNVVLTPHMGAHTVEAESKMGRQAAQNLIHALLGTPSPEVVVNRDVLRNWRAYDQRDCSRGIEG